MSQEVIQTGSGPNTAADDLRVSFTKCNLNFTELYARPTNVGTVTSVGLSMPSGFTVNNSPITTAGTLAVTTGLNGVLKGNGSGFLVATPGTDYLTPTGDGSGLTGLTKAQVGLSLVENTALSTWPGTTNITTLGTIGSGTWEGTGVGVQYGGTGLTSCVQGDLFYGSGVNNIAKLAKDANATRYVSNTGASNNPAWAQINLANGVTGILSSSNMNVGDSTGAISLGTAYSLTNTSSALVFGTLSPAIVIPSAGTWIIFAYINLQYTGATFAAIRTVTLKIRRTNNTPADLLGVSAIVPTQIVTTETSPFDSVTTAAIYVTALTNDAITIFGDVSVAPSAGSLDCNKASLFAVRIK